MELIEALDAFYFVKPLFISEPRLEEFEQDTKILSED